MPQIRDYAKHEIFKVLERIQNAVYTKVGKLAITAWVTEEPVSFNARESGKKLELRVGQKWGNLFDSGWFHFTGTIPANAAGETVVLLLDVNGELCIVDDKGTPVQGLTTVASSYDASLGSPGKTVFQIGSPAKGGEPVDIWADAGLNDLFGNLQADGIIKDASIAVCNEDIRQLYYDFEVLLDLVQVLPADTARCQQIVSAVMDASSIINHFSKRQVAEAREILAGELNKKSADPSLYISAVGHAHLDLAWLWPIRETIRKGARTFSTAIHLINRYPDYIFGASQAQLFQWMKDCYPALYEEIRQKIHDGRIDVQGVMWVEADTNLIGGESLIRQVLFGKLFFKKEFNREVDILWVPDVFGYSAALPQILKKAGIKYFATQKLSWSK
ncbi:MAG: alpha-mannosidase, partial [Spirochaetota bacterium]